jgi:hypothetical protein
MDVMTLSLVAARAWQQCNAGTQRSTQRGFRAAAAPAAPQLTSRPVSFFCQSPQL